MELTTKKATRLKLGATIVLSMRRGRIIKNRKKYVQKYFCRQKGRVKECLIELYS